MAKPFTIVYEHALADHTERTLQVGMSANHDVHFRSDAPGVAAVSHTMTMADFDALVEKVHEFHAEVPQDG